MKNSLNNTENIATTGLGFINLTAQTFAALVVSYIISLIISILTARILGPAGRGILTIIILYPTFLFTLGHLSIYRVSTIYISEKKYSFSDFPATTLIFIVTVSLLLIFGFIGVFFNFSQYFIRNVNFFVILLTLGLVPFFMVVQTFSSILQARKRMGEFNIATVVQGFLVLFFLIVTLIIFKKDINGAVFSYFIANFLTSLLLIYFVKKNCPDKWKFNLALLKELIRDGAKLHIGVIGSFIFLKIGILILGYYQQTSSVGYYAIATSMADLFILIPTAIQYAFYAKMPDMINNKADMLQKTILVYKHALFISIFVSLFLVVMAKPIITVIYGKKFLPAVIPFLILLPGTWYLWQNNILAYYLVGVKQFLTISIISIFGSFINIVFNFIFIPKHGAIGAALASLTTYAIIGSVYLFVFIYMGKLKFKEFAKNLAVTKKDIMLYKILLTEFNRHNLGR